MKLTNSVEPLMVIEDGKKVPKLNDNHDPLFTVTTIIMDGLACVFENAQQVPDHDIGVALYDGVMQYEQISAIDIIPAHFDIGEMLNDLDANENAAIVGPLSPDHCIDCHATSEDVRARLMDVRDDQGEMLCDACHNARFE